MDQDQDHAELQPSRKRPEDPSQQPPQQRKASALIKSNLELHTTGKNAASSSSNVRKYLHYMRKSSAKEPANPSRAPPDTLQTAGRRAPVPPMQNNRVRELSNGSGSLPKTRVSPSNQSHRSQIPDETLKQLPVIRPESRGSLHASMKSEHSSDGQSKHSIAQGTHHSRTPVLEPRSKSDSKGKGKEREKASKPPSECMSTSSDDDHKRSLRAKGLSDKSSDRGKSKDKRKNKSKRKKDKACSEDLPNEKQDKKKRKPKAEPSAKPAKESVNSDREKVLAARKERRREKALIVKDRSTVTAVSKKAKAVQVKEESSKDVAESSKHISSKSKRKKQASSGSSHRSRSFDGEFEEGLDITTAGKEEKRRKLNATQKNVLLLRESGQGKRKDPLRRASNMPANGRITVASKSGIYQNGHASAKVQVPAVSDLAFNEGPFLDQKHQKEPPTERKSSSSRHKPSLTVRKSSKAPQLERPRSRGSRSHHSQSREPSPESSDKPSQRKKSKALPWMAPENAPKRSYTSVKGKERTTDLGDSEKVYKASKRHTGHQLASTDVSEREPKEQPIRSPARRRAKSSNFSYRNHSFVAESRADISSDFDGLSAASLARRKADAKERSKPGDGRSASNAPKASTSRLPLEAEVVEHGQFAKAGTAVVKPRSGPRALNTATQLQLSDDLRNGAALRSARGVLPVAVTEHASFSNQGGTGQANYGLLGAQAGPSSHFVNNFWGVSRNHTLPPVSPPRSHSSLLNSSFEINQYEQPGHQHFEGAAIYSIHEQHAECDAMQAGLPYQAGNGVPSSPRSWQAGLGYEGQMNQTYQAEQAWQNDGVYRAQSSAGFDIDLNAVQRTLEFHQELEQAERSSGAWLFSSPKLAANPAYHQSLTPGEVVNHSSPAQGPAYEPNPAALLGLDIGPPQQLEPLENRFTDFWKPNRPY